MSIQAKSYNTKKSGRITKYFASVWDAKQKKSHTDPLRISRKEAVKDEAELIQKLEEGIKIETKNKKMSLGQAADSWLDATEGYYANSTLKTHINGIILIILRIYLRIGQSAALLLFIYKTTST